MKVGMRIMLLVVFAGLVAVGVWYGHGRWAWRHAQQLTVLFDSGIMPRPGAPVRYRGIDVGEVKAVRILPDSKRVVLVVFLKPEVSLKNDATVSLAQEGLLGQRLVQIDSLGEKGSVLKSGTPSRVCQSASLITCAAFEERLRTQTRWFAWQPV